MRSALWSVLAVIASVAAWITGSFLVRTVYAQRAQHATNIVSLTAEQVEVHSRNEQELDRLAKLKAIRGDGSTVDVRRFKGPDGRPVENKLVVDLTHKKRVAINGLAEAVTTYEIDETFASQLRARTGDPSCGLKGIVNRSTLLGYPVVSSVLEPSPGRRIEVFRSPELGCFELESTLTEHGVDGTITRMVRRTVKLSRGEPLEELFEIPAWPEMSPSQIRQAVNKRFPQVPPVPTEAYRPFDEAYAAGQAKKP